MFKKDPRKKYVKTEKFLDVVSEIFSCQRPMEDSARKLEVCIPVFRKWFRAFCECDGDLSKLEFLEENTYAE